MKVIKELRYWASAHPLQLILFTCAFAVIATAVALRADWLVPGVVLYGILALLAGVSIWRGVTKIGVFLLAGALLLPVRAEEQEKASGCGPAVVAVVVIVVGGYVIYRLVRFCQRKFPPTPPANQTNSPPARAEDTYAASYNWGMMGSCWPEDPCYGGTTPDEDYTTTTLEVSVLDDFLPGAQVQARLSAVRGDAGLMDWGEFQAAVKSYGVRVTGQADESQYFARNGSPISAGESPILFDPKTKEVLFQNKSGLPEYTVSVDRSTDLRHWTPILQTTVPLRTRLQFQDPAWEPQVFYRCRTRLAN